MTRALPSTAPTWTRRTFTAPWARGARIVEAHPVRVQSVTVDPVEAENLAANHNVEILTSHWMPTAGRARLLVRYTDRTVSTLPTGRRWPFQVEGLRGWAVTMLVIVGAVAALVGGGMAVWSAYGDSITYGLKLTGAGVLGVAVVAILAALFTGKSNCPGLHCSGCSKH